MGKKAGRREVLVLFGAVVIAVGALASYLRRSLKSDHACLVREMEENRQAVAQIQSLAADEAAIYLRGYMKGQADAGG